MNHRLYEEWLLAGEDPETELTQQQAAALQEHLQSCEACRALAGAWREVKACLQEEPVLAPKAGFTNRWEMRLEAERERSQQRQIIIALVFALGGVLALGSTLVVLVWPWLRSPSVVLWVGLYRLFELYSYVQAAQGLLSGMLHLAAGGVPVVWLMIFAGLLCEMGVLWVVSFRLLTNPRRVMK